MKTIYVGQLCHGSTALHRLWALQQLGCQVYAIDTTLPFGRYGRTNRFKRLMLSIAFRTNQFVDWKRVDSNLHRLSKNDKWDILWVDKGQQLDPQTLRLFKARQPQAKLVNYSPDDMFNPVNQTVRWTLGIPLYDLHVSTKTYNIPELIHAGAKDALFVGNAYEPTIHKPYDLTPEEVKRLGSDIVFIGASEMERDQSIEYLASRGLKIALFGNGSAWNRYENLYPNVSIHPGFIVDANYAKALCASKIALGFLRKQNRDLQTTRSIEVPACGVFMLAERTQEHLALFKEGEEAEFFASNEELFNKARYYLDHPAKRETIANAGRQRCIISGYSNAERLQPVLKYLSSNKS
ncbi:Spore protein YkvP [Pirellula sp. SH-Sr6A]|uniref:CgeB family protein n=1 Tax=Pirellula sp. SH-Sr6A TaxID=1632865 RepID=UPI00078CB633|nr:glycosyltransferase [Pirellula sp. SH-Sr6A]AMV31836.1 Spore protein YkvP [Pirellula sp. SH-Sr6A]